MSFVNTAVKTLITHLVVKQSEDATANDGSTPASEAILTEADFDSMVSTSGLECSLAGFKQMNMEGFELILSIFTLINEGMYQVLSTNMALSWKYGYEGFLGSSAWGGYITAALFYLAEDQGMGADMCEFYGYMYVAIDYLYSSITWEDTEANQAMNDAANADPNAEPEADAAAE